VCKSGRMGGDGKRESERRGEEKPREGERSGNLNPYCKYSTYTNDGIHVLGFGLLKTLDDLRLLLGIKQHKLTDTSCQPWSAAAVLAIIQQRAFGENVQLHSSS